jgi:hypothetical protein
VAFKVRQAMRRSRWISILALIGVLLHAGAIVRHNAAMTGANLQYQALLTGLSQLCHSATSGKVLAAAELPFVPKPTDAQNGCPICSGLSPAVALPTPKLEVAVVPEAVAIAFRPGVRCTPDSSHAVCPPARGPPAAA